MSWGYGVSMTPLQMLTFYNAIANDGVMVKPQFVKSLVGQGGEVKKTFETEVLKEKIASDETLNQLKKILENTVKKEVQQKISITLISLWQGKQELQKNMLKEDCLTVR